MKPAAQRTLVISLLIAIGAFPDALVPIALKSAVVDRWGVSLADAHWFAAAALLGALLSLPALRPLMRHWSAAKTIGAVSVANALALFALASPVSFQAAMGLRVITGAMDMITLAILLGLLERGNPDRAGHRYGPATLAIMLGLGCGFVVGGQLAASMSEGVFYVGAVFSLLLAVAAGGSRGLLQGVSSKSETPVVQSRYWPTLCFSFSDRALSAVLTITGSLYFIGEMDLQPELVGGALGLTLLAISLGAWPAGVLADRIGPLPVRIVSVIGYASAFSLLAVASWVPHWIVLVLLGTLGIFGAGLAPSMYMLAAQRQRGAVGMGGVQAAGSAGYLCGVLSAGILLSLRETISLPGIFQMIFLGFATAYLLLNLLAVAGMAGWRSRRLAI
ncbi:MAG: hypothetical protein P8I91_00575 [Phycisphaerales bacterium]|nr:hypothetical protein [Phycisphaerales bacterium]